MTLQFEFKKLLRPICIILAAITIAAGVAELGYDSMNIMTDTGMRNTAQYHALVKQYEGYVTPERTKIIQEKYNEAGENQSNGKATVETYAWRALGEDYNNDVSLINQWKANLLVANRSMNKIELGIYPQSDKPVFAKFKVQNQKLVQSRLYFMLPYIDSIYSVILIDRYFDVIILICITVMLLGAFPYEKKTMKLMRTTKTSIHMLTAMKLGAGLPIAAVISIIFTMIQFIFIFSRVGFNGLNSDFQAISIFQNSLVHLTIWQYLLVMVVLRILSSVYFAMIVLLI